MRVRGKDGRNSFYVHDVFVEEEIKVKAGSFQTRLNSEAAQSLRSTNLYRAILQESDRVFNLVMSKVSGISRPADILLDMKDARGATVVVPVELDVKKNQTEIAHLAVSAYGKVGKNASREAWFSKQSGGQAVYINRAKAKRWIEAVSGSHSPGGKSSVSGHADARPGDGKGRTEASVGSHSLRGESRFSGDGDVSSRGEKRRVVASGSNSLWNVPNATENTTTSLDSNILTEEDVVKLREGGDLVPLHGFGGIGYRRPVLQG